MIRIENVDKYFNRFKKNKIHVINKTSFTLGEKGLVALLGPSGSGKTTLLNTIGGLDKVGRGKIYIDGKKITWRSQNYVDKIRNLNIGYIFQDYKLIDNKSVYDNVAISLRLVGIKDKKEIDKRVLYVLEKVGMLRYKNRPCNMLSGGERQRVGIARAIVKNPNIIIADEPTGNLDSKNSIEIMNIIKAISKDKLVILVTHERNLAEFYSTRIIELEDGKIIKDYENEMEDELNYDMVSNIYLKDFEHKQSFDSINIYSKDGEVPKLDIAIINNNIYIKTTSSKNIEVIASDSTIEMIDDHYKNISRKDVEKYEFNFKNIINEPKKIKYSSIFNPITFVTNGLNQVINYSFLKKILLLGFFLSGIFIMYAISCIGASLTIKDENFVKLNKNYLIINSRKTKLEDYQRLLNEVDNYYMFPSDSETSIKLKVDDFYQLSKFSLALTGSVAATDILKEEDLILGRLPENEQEIVVDIMSINNALKKDGTKMYGFTNKQQFIDRVVLIDHLPNMKIVGISDLKSPSIYMDKSKFIEVLYHTKSNSMYDSSGLILTSTIYEEEESLSVDYYLYYQNDFTIKEGRLPENDYETIVPYSNKEQYKLNSEIDKKVNDKKLKVVGYYESKKSFSTNFVNYNTMYYEYITKTPDITIYPKNATEAITKVQDEFGMSIEDSYQKSRDNYINSRKDFVTASIISSLIILVISLIEIILMIRSSFLSRVKEVGIYRAIGIKKRDIYTMFSGEIIAITTIASLPGIVLAAYLLNILSSISYVNEFLLINPYLIVSAIILVYVFNLIVGLIPVFNTIRKRPAEILSRTDI